ncbi:hypothetical protein COBT_000068 [Conglomerata obtusa]
MNKKEKSDTTNKCDMNEDKIIKKIASQNSNNSKNASYKEKLNELRIDLFGQDQTEEKKEKTVNKICFLPYSLETSLFNGLMQIFCTRYDLIEYFITIDFNDSQKICEIVQTIIFKMLTEKNADISKEISEIYYICINDRHPPLNAGNSLHIWSKCLDIIILEAKNEKKFFPKLYLIKLAYTHFCNFDKRETKNIYVDTLFIAPGYDVRTSLYDVIYNLKSRITLDITRCEICLEPLTKARSAEAIFSAYFLLEVKRQSSALDFSYNKTPMTLNKELNIEGLSYKLKGIICLPKDKFLPIHTVILKKKGKWIGINSSTTQEVDIRDPEITTSAWLLSYQLDEC